MACSYFLSTPVRRNMLVSSRRRDVIMRHTRQSTIFLLSATLFLSGCATSGKSTSPPHDHDPEPALRSARRPSPPPPAPAAYGISHVKTIGFLRAFSSKDDAADRSCGMAPCAEGCCPAPRSHANDRHPCLAERLEDPFLDQLPEQESKPEQPQAPQSHPAPPAARKHQALSPLPHTGVSTGRPSDSYFPTKSGRQRSIVEPPRWQERHTTRSAATYHSVTQETKSTPVFPASV